MYEKRKQEHIERGYRIEEERPIPANRFCSFVAVTELPASDELTELVAPAVNGKRGLRGCHSASQIFPPRNVNPTFQGFQKGAHNHGRRIDA